MAEHWRIPRIHPDHRALAADREIDAVVLKALEKKANRRFTDVKSFVEALRTAVTGERKARSLKTASGVR